MIRDFEFDHVGIAVRSIAEGEKFYQALGFGAGHDEVVEKEKVRVKMYTLANDARVELLEPTSNDSTIAKFLDKRGPGIHHICMRVKNIRKVLSDLKKNNVRLIHEEPFVGADACLVAFVHPSAAGGVLIELSEPMVDGGEV